MGKKIDFSIWAYKANNKSVLLMVKKINQILFC